MIPALEPHATPTPAWLMRLTPADIAEGPEACIQRLVQDALVYPGSGDDGSPVRQFSGVLHSFIFMDYLMHPAELQAQLNRPLRSGTGFAHHRLVGLSTFDAEPLVAAADQAFRVDGRNIHDGGHRKGLWAIYESLGPAPLRRFSFLHLPTEAIQSLAALFPSAPPKAVVVQEHGFGGNCWSSFSGKLQELACRWRDVPEWLVLGSNHGLHRWHRHGRSLGTDLAGESMHRNVREILHLDAEARRRCRLEPHLEA